MRLYEFWNYVSIAALVLSAVYNIAYFIRHENGKKYLRLVSGLVLLYALALRLIMAWGRMDRTDYSDLILPIVWLIYLLPAADAFVDWQGKRKSE